MRDVAYDDRQLDDVARITQDVQRADNATLGRLRSLVAATLRATPDAETQTIVSRLIRSDVSEEDRRTIREALVAAAKIETPPVCMVRVDEREDLIEGRVAGPLSALAGAERLGPFVVDGGRVWFDFYHAAQRFVVTETGASSPAFVLTSARRPAVLASGSLTLDLQEGTVWIRGDLLTPSLPAGAYVGITVTDGTIALPDTVDVTDDEVEISAPAEATLQLALDPGEPAVAEGGCHSDSGIELSTLALHIESGHLDVEIEGGAAGVWGQVFEFGGFTGAIDFVAPLWSLVLGVDFRPEELCMDGVSSEVCDFREVTRVLGAGLGLPVVVADPSILGPTEITPGWWLALEGFQARWYASDERFHTIDGWMCINSTGISLFSDAAPGLERPVSTCYRLWELKESPDHRVPWQLTYEDRFVFYYRCDTIQGEDLLATGESDVALDRPVLARGEPVRTPTAKSAIHLHRAEGAETQITLVASTKEGAPENLLVLRNALCWTTRAAMLVAQGSLMEREDMHAGALHVLFGVLGWTPTLPDPYVGNFQLCKPVVQNPSSLLVARVSWDAPADVITAFNGQLGAPVVCDKPASVWRPVPLRQDDLDPDLGLTQTAQHTRHLSEEELGAWREAQAKESRDRDNRQAVADRENARSHGMIEGYVREMLGPTPSLLLLDVSTNQDLLGVALWGTKTKRRTTDPDNDLGAGGAAEASVPSDVASFPVQSLEVRSSVESLRLVTLPQVQWEPVRTLDEDQDILTLGWFPTPLASATDGGATVLGARWQKLAPVIPEDVLKGTQDAFDSRTQVIFRTTLPFGLITAVTVNPDTQPDRPADIYEQSRPEFPSANAVGGMQITAKAEGARPDDGSMSPCFDGVTRQLINGVDLITGSALGLSVLSSVGDPNGDVETIFNNDMGANPKVPVTRFDLSGYGGSNFSEWEDPLALFAATSKTQFKVVVGRTALEIIKVASVLHPWGIRVTRSVIVERKSGGGVIRRDTGWQATSPGLLDYRYYTDQGGVQPKVAPYDFDAGIFKGLFGVRSIRPAPGLPFSDGTGSTMVPYYFDAEVKLDGLATGSTQAIGVLGWLQTAPSGEPASVDALKQLIEAQGPIGGPVDAWLEFGASKLPFRARRIEIGLADDAGSPLFVATVRGLPKFPKTGAWSVVCREIQGVPTGGGEAVPVSETNGAPLVRRCAVEYAEGDTGAHTEPPLRSGASPGYWRIADAEDLLDPANPKREYCVLQSAPTHAFLFPRPYARDSGDARLRSNIKPELADIIARSTSKGAFPPPENAIQLGSTRYFDVGAGGTLALSSPVSIVNHPTPLRLSGSAGHGSELLYDAATLQLDIDADTWSAEFNGLEIWSDIAGLERTSGARFRIVGSTTQRPQIAQIDTLVHETIEKILTYLPIFGVRDPLGPVDLGATNSKLEIRIDVHHTAEVPKLGWEVGNGTIKLSLGTAASVGFDDKGGGVKNSGTLKAGLNCEIPLTPVVYFSAKLDIAFSVTSISGTVTAETLNLTAFVGIGVKGSIAGFKAYAYLGIGFILSYDILNDITKYGGIVRLEAGVEVYVVKVKLTAELQGLIYKKPEALPAPATGTVDKTVCDYSGKVKLQVEIFLIISISATYSFSGTKEFE